jgi:uncharacterized protein YndB with AHSA1/START domain
MISECDPLHRCPTLIPLPDNKGALDNGSIPQPFASGVATRNVKNLKDNSRKVDHQYFVKAPAARVFEAITDPEWLTKWLVDQAEISPRKGGRYSLSWKDGPTHTGTVLELEPGRSLTLSWEWEGVDVHGTEFRLSVEPKDDGALLSVQHTGFPPSEKWVDLYGGAEWGWTYFAMNLKSVLETGHDLRSKYDG